LEAKNSKASIVVFAVVAVKFLPKLLNLAKLGKVGLAATSVGIYSLVFNWKFALSICEMIYERRNRGGYSKRREKYERKIREFKEEVLSPRMDDRPSRELRFKKRMTRLERRIDRCVEEEAKEQNRPSLTAMTKPEIIKSAAGILSVAAASFAIMFAVSNIPGADLALDALTD
jgi:hypothetical protein